MKGKHLGTVKQLTRGIWHVRGFIHKETELKRKLKLMNLDTLLIPETKKNI